MSSPQREMAVCREHGLRYDRISQQGCVICRREGGAAGAMPSSRPSSAAEPEAEGRDYKSWVVVGLLLAVAGAGLWALFVPRDAEVYDFLEAVREQSIFEGADRQTLERFQDLDESASTPGGAPGAIQLAEETRSIVDRRRQEIAALTTPYAAEAAAAALDELFADVDTIIDATVRFLRFASGLRPGRSISASTERTLRRMADGIHGAIAELEAQCDVVNTQIEALVEQSAPRWSRATMKIDFCDPNRNW